MRALRATLAHEDIETTFSLAHKMCRNVLRKRMSTNLQMDEHSWILCMCGIRVCYEIKHPVIIVATRNDMVLIAKRRMCINGMHRGIDRRRKNIAYQQYRLLILNRNRNANIGTQNKSADLKLE